MESTSVRVEPLRRDGDFVLSRQSFDGDDGRFLLLTPATDQPTVRIVQRLEHEYMLRDQLDSTWAARPLALVQDQGRPALRLRDPGGQLLADLMGQPWEIATFLRVAIGILVSLRRIHEQGLLHKDVKPGNVLTYPATGEAWFTGFGMASRLPRERRPPDPPRVIAGTLAYMAPEQTGRMNRSVDSRSDLYSLGVTFYEMLTGQLPFEASDPMEWVHCHIARMAPRVDEKNCAVPAQIVAIVDKLLAKPAECRYQTAAGVEADLRRCLQELDSAGNVHSFSLGVDDVPDRLLMPEKLYGRERDIETLLAAFDRVVSDNTLEVVLVSGYSGIGKSSVVHELHKALVPRGLFASGKFDQFKRDIPYATLAQALESLIRMVLVRGEAEFARWRDAIGRAVGPNGKVMADLIPELEIILGPQAPVPDLPASEAQNRLQMVFRQFIGVFARPEHPLALFLDDLQWLDTATLKLIQSLVTSHDSLSLLLIGAYRDNEIHAAHPLTPALDAIRKSVSCVHEIVLTELGPDEVAQLVADACHTDVARVRPLANLVYDKTIGNPFFTIEFLSELAHDELLAFDAGTGTWTWNTDRIGAKRYTDNVVELMAAKLTRLAQRTQEGLKHLACLGNKASSSTLALVHEGSEESLETELWEAVRAGIVLFSNDTYAFLHDRIQEAAYSLIRDDLRAQAHLRIGRLLRSRLDDEAAAESVFDVVSHLNRAEDLIDDPDERLALRRLNAKAGRMAKASTAYASARDYFLLATALSPPESWTQDYAETFDLHLLLAECEFLVGNFRIADELFGIVLDRARSTVDHAAACCVRMQLYQVAGRYEEAFLLAQGALLLFDRDLPETDKEIRSALASERRLVPVLLAGRKVAELAEAPQITDPSLRALVDLLVYAGPCAYVGKPSLFPLVTLLAINLSLRHGNTEVSCRAYAAYAVMLVAMFDDIPTAVQFSELALRLNENLGKPRDRGSLLLMHGHMVVPWKHPFAYGFSFQDMAFSTCLEVGDFAYAGYLAFLSVWQLIEKGDSLDDVLAGSVKYAAFARQTNNDPVYQTIRLEQQFVAGLQGKTDDPLALGDASFDEAASIATIVKATFGTGIAFYHVMKQILAFLHGRYSEALAEATNVEPFLGPIMAVLIEATHHFYHALTLAALLPDAPAAKREAFARALGDKARKFAQWAAECPENFSARNYLLMAEIARIEGRDLDAMQLYETAIRAARANGVIQDEALALELAGQFYGGRGLETTARAHLRDARYRYERWGAEAKVRQLESRHSSLRDEPARTQPSSAIGAPVEHLDLSTIVRVLQSLASEIVLEKWIERLMAIALEDAGAQRGILLVPHGGALQTLAEAITRQGGFEVRLPKPADDPAAVPSSVLRYVARTHETVLLDDAAAPTPFSTDPYIVDRKSRSIFCVPLVKQGKLAGVLYLENDLAPGVFTPRRTAVLKLVVSQAAISLDNARLYTDLQRENDVRRRTEDALRRSEAYLAEAQRVSRTGSFGWDVATGALVWSDETYRLIGFDRSSKPTLEDVLARVHPDDIGFVRGTLGRAVESGGPIDYEQRFVMPDGSVKFLRVLGRPVRDASGGVEYVGAAMDVTEQHRAEAALQHAQAELAHVMRVTALGELAASIAHEVNQPLAAISANANAALNWLAFSPPDVEAAHDSLRAIVTDSERAGDILSRIRGLLSRSPSERRPCDVNALVSGVLPLVRSQFERHRIVLEAALATELPSILGDQVQLQQVLLNLLLNAADACKGLAAERRRVTVRTSVERRRAAPWAVVVVTDAGKGIDLASVSRIFDAFYTTKPDGLGMGLSISRSIVVRHDGELIAAPNDDHGATFSFRLPGLA